MLNPLFRAGLKLAASGSIAANEMLADTTATNAFVAPVGVDLSAYQTGKYIFAAYNTVGGYAAFGYISGTAPGGEAYANVFVNTDMELNANWTGFLSTPSTFQQSDEQAHGGTYSWKCVTSSSGQWGIGQGNKTLIQGGLYFSDIWYYKTSATANNMYVALDSGRIDSFPGIGPTLNTWTSKSGYVTKTQSGASPCGALDGNGLTATTMYIDDFSLKQVTDCAATGALIVSAKDGATRAWAYKHASFDPNIASTYKLYYVGD